MGTIKAVSAKHNVDLVGRRMSGRSRLTGDVARHFRSLKYEVIEIPALPMLRKSPLAASGLAGLGESTTVRVAENITERIGKGKGLIIADDWDYLDAETWAAIAHVHATHNVPIVTTRVINRRSPGPFSHPGFTPARSFTIPRLNVSSLGALAQLTFGVTLSPAALANLAAISSGDAGVAKALVGFALEDGTLHVENGLATLRGFSLWTDGASSVAEALLSSLSDQQRTAMETIYTIGVAPKVDIAVDMIGKDLLSELADMDLVGLSRTATGERIVRLRSGLIVEHFRRQRDRLRLWLLLEESSNIVEDTLTRPLGGSHLNDVELLTSAFGIQRHVLEDAEAKHAESPTLATASHLLGALETVGADDAIVQKLEDESWELEGTDAEAATWGTAVFHLHIWGDGHVAKPLAWLEELARNHPSTEGTYRVQRTIWLMAMGKDPELDKLPTDYTGLVPHTETNANWARLFCLTLTGQLGAARDLIESLGGRPALPSHFWALAALIEIVDGNTPDIMDEAHTRFGEARDRGRLAELAEYVYIAGLAALGTPAEGKTWDMLIQFRNLGAPIRQRGLIQAISTARAIAGFVVGEALAPIFHSPRPFVPSPYPGVSKDWEAAVTAAAEGRLVESGRIAGKVADTEWARGHKLAAAFSYMLAAAMDPTPRRAARIRERVLPIGAPAFNSLAGWLLPLCDGDPEAAEAHLEASQFSNAYSWIIVARVWDARGENIRADAARRRGPSSVGRAGKPTPGWGFPDWTAREKEVVRYIAAGLQYAEIAEILGLSPRTVEGIGSRAMKKANVSTRAELVRWVESA